MIDALPASRTDCSTRKKWRQRIRKETSTVAARELIFDRPKPDILCGKA
jgi:hypothetical protein